MGRKKLRATKKVSASKYYKHSDIKRMSRKERDKQLYRKTKDEGVKIHVNSTPASSVPGIIDKVNKINEDENNGDADANEVLSEALKAAMPLYGTHVQIKTSKSVKKKEDRKKEDRKKDEKKEDEKKKAEEEKKASSDESDENSKNNKNPTTGKKKHERIKEDVIADLKAEDHKNDLKRKNDTSQSEIKSSVNNEEHKNEKLDNKMQRDEILRKRKIAEAAYADYILWKKEQIKNRKEKYSKTTDKTDRENTSYQNYSDEKKKDESEKDEKKEDEKKEKNKKEDSRRHSRRKKRVSRVINPLVKNVKRNISEAGYEVKHMPVKTLRMITDDISADELAMRTGRGIMASLSRIYKSAMKTVGAAVKSLALLAAGVLKDILIAFAPVLLIGFIIIFIVYFIFLSPMQSIMGGRDSGEEETIQNSDILKKYCRQALIDSADELQQKLLTLKPDASIKVMEVTEENVNDMCKIITVVMALNGAYPDDEDWLSDEGQGELKKYADFMCHQMDQSEIDEQTRDKPDETTTEETTTQPATEEQTTEQPTEDTETNEIWIGYYSYEYLFDTGYLSDIEEFL